MKKILATVITIAMVLSTMIVGVAEETSDFYVSNVQLINANDTSAVYESGVMYYRGFNHTNSPCFHLLSSGLTTDLDQYNRYQLRKSPLIYKIPLPRVGNSQELEQFNIHFTSGTSNLGTTYVLKFEGEGWENIEGISSAHESVTAITNNLSTYSAKEGSYQSIVATGGAGSSYSRIKADITGYAKECMDKNQTYMYIGLYCNSTTSAYGFRSKAGEVPIISFKVKNWDGLKTKKEKLSFDDVASVWTTKFECPIPNLASIHSNDASGGYALFKMPLPTLDNTQTIVDYKLYFGIRTNLSVWGYDKFSIYKVPDGDGYFENRWTTTEHPIASASRKIDGSKNYLNKGSMNYNWSANGYSQYEYTPIDLTSYAKELLSGTTPVSHMYVAMKDNTGSTVSLYGSGTSYYPYVEYTIHDVDGYTSGISFNELKLVPNTSLMPYSGGDVEVPSRLDTAQDVETLIAGTNYRAVLKASNYTDDSVTGYMYIAIYSESELESVTPVRCIIDDNDNDVCIWSNYFSVDSPGKTVKVFLWDSDGNPLILEKCATVLHQK